MELSWEGTSEHSEHSLPFPPAQYGVSLSRLLRAMSCWVLTVSEDGDDRMLLYHLFQYSATLTGKKHFFSLNGNPAFYYHYGSHSVTGCH